MEATPVPFLVLECSCGTRLKVKEDSYGKRVRCPKCLAVLKAEAPKDDFELRILDEPEPPKPKPQPPPKKAVPRRTPPRGAARRPVAWIGLREGIPMGIAVTLLLLNGVNLGRLIAILLEGSSSSAAGVWSGYSTGFIGFFAALAGAVGLAALLFLLRSEGARLFLMFACALFAISLGFFSVLGASYVGLFVALAYAVGAVVFWAEPASDYCAGGPPDPRISLGVTAAAAVAAVALGLMTFGGTRSELRAVAKSDSDLDGAIRVLQTDVIRAALSGESDQKSRIRDVRERIDGLERDLEKVRPSLRPESYLVAGLKLDLLRLAAHQVVPLSAGDLAALKSRIRSRVMETRMLVQGKDSGEAGEIRALLDRVEARVLKN